MNRAVFVLSLMAAFVSPSIVQADPQNLEARIPGSYTAVLKQGESVEKLKTVFGSYGIHSITRVEGNTYTFKVHKDPGPAAMEAKAKSAPSIIKVQANLVYRGP